ncbi:MAG TPA: allantoinase AllB [Pyrinomonadaceae bacterium]|jgi:allantoinase|nr:allantoinase AllB [Pyrinomonadaceae bacterium]
MPLLVIRGRRVVTEQSIGPASLQISRGVIEAIERYDDIPSDCELIEAAPESIIMPGLVDTHVHVNEPGRTEWEGFETATRAAAAGGVTTIIDMPLNSIPATTTRTAFEEKHAAAQGKLTVDAGFWGGVVPGNTRELEKLWSAGVVGFKCFLVHSGVDEFPNVTEADLREAMPQLARLSAPLIVHAELPGPIEASECNQSRRSGDNDGRHYETFLRSRPRTAENEAVEFMIRLSRETGCRVHIVHLSSADAIEILRAAKAEGALITAETCPHYLHFAAEEIPEAATEFKCCPPIRESQNREQLWEALKDGTIDMVVSDHSPCPPEMKLREQGDFMQAWGGISSLQLRLPVMWTEAKRRGFSLIQLTEWLCHAPAKLVGLDRRKGAIAIGRDADIVIWNPHADFRVAPEMIHHRHKLTPYMGEVLSGKVEKTFLRGRIVYDDGEFIADRKGLPLLRTSG